MMKKILIITLICSLTIPSNAAVSVSDGAAFVSKGEFTADISNISKRVTQLENTIEAKIDSLVSSYLSRNGIWNGKKQELIATDFSVTNQGFSHDVYRRTFSGHIFTANKSGLVFVNGKYSYLLFAESNMHTDGTVWGGNFTFFYILTSANSDNYATASNRENLVSLFAQPIGIGQNCYRGGRAPSSWIYYIFPATNVSITLSGFVNKGTSYYMLGFGYISVENVSFIRASRKCKMSIHIDDATVY